MREKGPTNGDETEARQTANQTSGNAHALGPMDYEGEKNTIWHSIFL